MDGHICYHCKQWVEAGESHDCWTTTETALTADLDEDLRDAWDRVRETAVEFGEQRIYASHKSIMFSRKSCYFFVRPKRSVLELNVFLGRAIKAPQIKKVIQSSAAKKVHVIHVRHRDEVEAPISEWLREAYEFAGQPRPAHASKKTARAIKKTKATTSARIKPGAKGRAKTADSLRARQTGAKRGPARRTR